MVYDLKITPQEWKIKPKNEVEEILQNVLTILLTEKFSVPLDRDLGISGNILDAPINAQAKLTAEIAKAVKTYEPRARVEKVTFGGDMTDGQLLPTITIEIDERNLRGYV